MEVFCVTILGGLYLEGLTHGGAYVRNFSFLPLDFTKQENQPSINQIFLFVQWLKNQTLSFYYNHKYLSKFHFPIMKEFHFCNRLLAIEAESYN